MYISSLTPNTTVRNIVHLLNDCNVEKPLGYTKKKNLIQRRLYEQLDEVRRNGTGKSEVDFNVKGRKSGQNTEFCINCTKST